MVLGDGGIWRDRSGTEGEFITDIARKQIAGKCVFQVGGAQVLAWGLCPPDAIQELARRSRMVVDVLL